MTDPAKNSRGRRRKKRSTRLGFTTIMTSESPMNGASTSYRRKAGESDTQATHRKKQKRPAAVTSPSGTKRGKEEKKNSNAFYPIRVCCLDPSFPKESAFDWDSPELGLMKLGPVLKKLLPFKPFTHQATALRALLIEGKDLIIYVGTGSGKTEIYLFAGVELLLQQKVRNIILLFPTKALLKDQLGRVADFVGKINKHFFSDDPSKFLSYAEYSGGVPLEEIKTIERQRPEILLATFDKFWFRLFRPAPSVVLASGAVAAADADSEEFLEYLLSAGMLVLDEIHILKGLVASHIHEVLKCHKKRNPEARLLLCSATIGGGSGKVEDSTNEGEANEQLPNSVPENQLIEQQEKERRVVARPFSRPSFRTDFLPGTAETTAMIVGPSRRGPMEIFIVDYLEVQPLLEFFLKELLREEWEKELCLIFGNSIAMIQTLQERLLRKVLATSKTAGKGTSNDEGKTTLQQQQRQLKKRQQQQQQQRREKAVAEAIIGIIYAGMIEEKKNEIQAQILARLKRMIFCTCLLELGMNFPNVMGVISVNFPITGPAGLKQQFGRVRPPEDDPCRMSYGILVLDRTNPLEEFYYDNPVEIERILRSPSEEPVFFSPYNYELIKATILLRVIYGCRTKAELFSLCKKEPEKKKRKEKNNRSEEEDDDTLLVLYQRAFVWLLFQGMLHVSSDGSLRIGDKNILWQFIKQHNLRIIDEQFTLHLLQQRTNSSTAATTAIGTISRQKVLREALPGNLLRHDGQTFQVKRTDFSRKRILLEKVTVTPGAFATAGRLPRNKLSIPELTFSHKQKKKKVNGLLCSYGPLTFLRKATAIVEYQPDGFVYRELEAAEEYAEEYAMTTRTFGLSLDFSKVAYLLTSPTSSEEEDNEAELRKKNAEDAKKAFYRSLLQLLLIECERLLGVPTSTSSELAAKINKERNLLIIYDKGRGSRSKGGGGNAHQIFLRLEELLAAVLRRLSSCSCVAGCPKCYSQQQLLRLALVHRLHPKRQQQQQAKRSGKERRREKRTATTMEAHSKQREAEDASAGSALLANKQQLVFFLEELLKR